VLVDVVDGADAGVIELGGRLRLALEPLQGVRVLGQLLRQELERYLAPEARVFRLVDDTHAAAPELGIDAVVRDRLADHGVLSCRGN
jgi:hypothetical protein